MDGVLPSSLQETFTFRSNQYSFTASLLNWIILCNMYLWLTWIEFNWIESDGKYFNWINVIKEAKMDLFFLKWKEIVAVILQSHIVSQQSHQRGGKERKWRTEQTKRHHKHHINRMNAYQISNAGNAMNNKFSSTMLAHIKWIVVCSFMKLADRICECMHHMRTWRKELSIPLIYQFKLLVYFYGRGLTIIIKID